MQALEQTLHKLDIPVCGSPAKSGPFVTCKSIDITQLISACYCTVHVLYVHGSTFYLATNRYLQKKISSRASYNPAALAVSPAADCF